MSRPNMTGYFKSRIEYYVHGMLASTVPAPTGVRVKGDVTDKVIVVTDRDGVEWYWQGGQFSARKAHGTYAPLMPKPLKARPPQQLEPGKHAHCKALGCYNRIQYTDTCSRCGGRVTVEEGCCT